MSGVLGYHRNLRALNKALKTVSETLAIKVAKRAAGTLTRALRTSYDGGLTAYDDPRPLGVHGNPLTLYKTGTIRRNMAFVSDGTSKLRVALTKEYARYLIGKYRILPIGNAALPFAWQALLRQNINAEIRQILEEGGSAE